MAPGGSLALTSQLSQARRRQTPRMRSHTAGRCR